MRGPSAQNQIDRWEKKFPRAMVIHMVRDAYFASHSPTNKAVYRSWLTANNQTLPDEMKQVARFFSITVESLLLEEMRDFTFKL